MLSNQLLDMSCFYLLFAYKLLWDFLSVGFNVLNMMVRLSFCTQYNLSLYWKWTTFLFQHFSAWTFIYNLSIVRNLNFLFRLKLNICQEMGSAKQDSNPHPSLSGWVPLPLDHLPHLLLLSHELLPKSFFCLIQDLDFHAWHLPSAIFVIF